MSSTGKTFHTEWLSSTNLEALYGRTSVVFPSASSMRTEAVVPASSILTFWTAALVLIAIPGPDWAYAINAGLRRHVVPAACGIVAGYIVMTAAVATGLGLLVASTPAALTAFTLIGGLYLVWLGVQTVRHRAVVEKQADGPMVGARATLLKGIAVSGLNPKGLLIFLALLPQFTSTDAAWPVPVQLAVLGGVFAATCGVVYLAVGAAAHAFLRARRTAGRIVAHIAGTAMVLLGLALVSEHLCC